MRILLFLFLGLSPIAALAQTADTDRLIAGAAQLMQAKSLRCQFTSGSVAARSEDGKTNIRNDQFQSGKDFLIIDSIDTKTGRARLIGNVGAIDIFVFTSQSGLHFLEKSEAGNITLTSVFVLKIKDNDKYIAVHTRHHSMVPIVPTVAPSQYHGSCEIFGK